MNTEERLKLLLVASSEQIIAIDCILEGKNLKAQETVGPLLLKMDKAAKFLGVSRTTLWRMIEKGRLKKIEVLPGSFRLRRTDLESIAKGNE